MRVREERSKRNDRRLQGYRQYNPLRTIQQVPQIQGKKMKETGDKKDPILCHGCKFGGEVVECCQCPKLTAWRVMPKTIKNIQLLAAGEAVAKSKGIEGFDPVRYIAVAIAVDKGECKYYRPAEKIPIGLRE